MVTLVLRCGHEVVRSQPNVGGHNLCSSDHPFGVLCNHSDPAWRNGKHSSSCRSLMIMVL